MPRPKGSKNKSTMAIRALIDKISDDMIVGDANGVERAIRALIEKAVGVEVQTTDNRDGSVRVYSQPPDPAAARLLMEYRFGKVKDQVGMSLEENENGDLPQITVFVPKFTDKS